MDIKEIYIANIQIFTKCIVNIVVKKNKRPQFFFIF